LQVLCIPKPISIITSLDPWQRCVAQRLRFLLFCFCSHQLLEVYHHFQMSSGHLTIHKDLSKIYLFLCPTRNDHWHVQKAKPHACFFTIYTCQYIGNEDEWYKQFYAWKLLPKLIFTMTSTAWKIWSLSRNKD
jgi:hypothetical protein